MSLDFFKTGTIVFVLPHMDDETLASGGLIARLNDKQRLHFIFATDGMQSPAPGLPSEGSVSPDLGHVRMEESRAALKLLGIPQENISFLELPDAQLRDYALPLRQRLTERFHKLPPDFLFTPFRYDRHPDHLVVHRETLHAAAAVAPKAKILEYFVYFSWPLLGNRDIRQDIHPDHMITVDVSAVLPQKQAALAYFKTQITCFYPWQKRPALSQEFADRLAKNPTEYFFLYQPGKPIFARNRLLNNLTHMFHLIYEPYIRPYKKKATGLWKRVGARYAISRYRIRSS